MEDEPISPFPRFVSGSGRAVTPIKHRTITPTSSSQQNQQTRSISKLKMAQAIIDSQPSEKYISHRKQRKWENANMILLQRILSRKNDVSTLFPDESHTMPGPQRDQARCDFNLLREMDKDPMFSFMRVQGANKSKRIMRDDEWSVEEAKWINNVKKQLRGVVLELLEKKEDLFEYLRSLEMVLWCFMESQSTPAIEDLPSSFLELLTTRPGTEPTRTDSVGLRVDEGKLILPLKDLPLTRLVTFAACQFYGLHTEVMGLQDGGRTVEIRLPRSTSSLTTSDASLFGYLTLLVVGPATDSATDLFASADESHNAASNVLSSSL